MSDEAAMSQWQIWSAMLVDDPNTTELFHDRKGPGHSPLRVWIETSDKVLFQDSVERAKMLKLAEKESKAPSQTEIDSMHKKLFTDHDKAGRASQSLDLRGLAPNMMQQQHGWFIDWRIVWFQAHGLTEHRDAGTV